MKLKKEKHDLNAIPDKIWDELSPKIKRALDISIEQCLKKEVKPYEEVIAQGVKKYTV